MPDELSERVLIERVKLLENEIASLKLRIANLETWGRPTYPPVPATPWWQPPWPQYYVMKECTNG